MKSHSTSTLANASYRDSGFTLIELILVLAIISFVATFGIIAGIDTYARYSFHSDAENAVSMLQKARSEAVNNIGGSPHGVYVGADSSSLVLFQGASYVTRDQALDLKIEKARTVSYSDTCMDHSVVFVQFSGEAAACTVSISNISSSAVAPTLVTINSEGGIDW